jgi:hypothetical protein
MHDGSMAYLWVLFAMVCGYGLGFLHSSINEVGDRLHESMKAESDELSSVVDLTDYRGSR